MHRYAEYKASLIQADGRDDATRDAGRAAAGPVPIGGASVTSFGVNKTNGTFTPTKR